MSEAVRNPREDILAFIDHRIGAPALYRALSAWNDWWVAGENPGGEIRPATIDSDGQPGLWVFTDEERLRAAPRRFNAALNRVLGANLFAGLPDTFTRVEFDQG